MVQKQSQLSKLKVSTCTSKSLEIPLNNCDSNPDDLPVALRKEKRSFVKYAYPSLCLVPTKHLSVQCQSFISAIDSIGIPKPVQEALKHEKWVQAMNENHT